MIVSTLPTLLGARDNGIHPCGVHDLDDPYPELSALTRAAPVSRVGDSNFYLVTGWDAIAEGVARPEDFSSNLTATMVWKEGGKVEEYPIAELGSPIHVLATVDDPSHKAHRAMVMPSLVAKRVRALEPFIDVTVERLWSEGLRDGRIDWVAAVAQRLPMAVVAELLGSPPSTPPILIGSEAFSSAASGRWPSESTADGISDFGHHGPAAQLRSTLGWR
ncbi:hypothetical protein QM583_11050 [Gordonia alkanivorans]|uniref:hypothetical protein n=1 Tax=Gordonia alkanivorans TaxID=84096 RepID=UPI0024480978|nr:hypothetical protein [Gordonia alkanivorans]MDH3049325.1 hypothetical protein [Gordonia alkanivorans]MDJ0027621.1 hypothetical protein [Gordonia alkanivorans]